MRKHHLFQTTNAPTNAPIAVLHPFMAVIGDSTDPQGTTRPKEDPILVCAHIFKPVIVADRPSKPCLPSNVPINDP